MYVNGVNLEYFFLKIYYRSDIEISLHITKMTYVFEKRNNKFVQKKFIFMYRVSCMYQ